MQRRLGSDKLAVILIDVDPGYYEEPEDYLPKAKKILERLKLEWPNAMAPKGFHDTIRFFNMSGYGNVIVDAKGIVRGVDIHGAELDRLITSIIR